MITKTFTITFYSPRELWVRFWNRFYWPRRKQCAEWMDLVEVKLDNAIIHDIVWEYYDKGIIGYSLAEDLELTINQAIKDVCSDFKEVITKPI